MVEPLNSRPLTLHSSLATCGARGHCNGHYQQETIFVVPSQYVHTLYPSDTSQWYYIQRIPVRSPEPFLTLCQEHHQHTFHFLSTLPSQLAKGNAATSSPALSLAFHLGPMAHPPNVIPQHPGRVQPALPQGLQPSSLSYLPWWRGGSGWTACSTAGAC